MGCRQLELRSCIVHMLVLQICRRFSLYLALWIIPSLILVRDQLLFDVLATVIHCRPTDGGFSVQVMLNMDLSIQYHQRENIVLNVLLVTMWYLLTAAEFHTECLLASTSQVYVYVCSIFTRETSPRYGLGWT